MADKLKVATDRVETWERTGQLRYRQAERLAKVTRTPFGFLFLPEPPEEPLGIPDFRTVTDAPLAQPSPELIDTVQQMQRRQVWMRDYLMEEGAPPLPFVGSTTLEDPPERIAAGMREVLALRDGWAALAPNWSEALRRFRQRLEAAGILVFVNGIVGNNTHRPLSVQEFRGFALSDAYAPLIFINGADAKAAQLFTMAHEAAHLWLGAGGVSNLVLLEPAPDPLERLCNAAAAELLVPAELLRSVWPQAQGSAEPYQFLARHFKVSPIVAARRAQDLALISRPEFLQFYQAYEADERRNKARKAGGGDFWNTQNVRLGGRFGAAVARATKEGRLLYREAYRLTGLRGATFEKFAKSVGVDLR
ncbi:ImmA/IrrE family metallo-endopeptidase [uncultured Thiohalocapsa sp.]|uniref:ImmA/IrrE family metallo-endopeptidase n=1 Tax=uncultured Thiohalocapsa sp. TaxID=768990 RepID=UPI0025EC381D|nr:ImmA/IrrE family metallo-endopeptidase [uncultured Thiohalocapsa sp.]